MYVVCHYDCDCILFAVCFFVFSFIVVSPLLGFFFFFCQSSVIMERMWILAGLSSAAAASHSWFASHSSDTLTSILRVGTTCMHACCLYLFIFLSPGSCSKKMDGAFFKEETNVQVPKSCILSFNQYKLPKLITWSLDNDWQLERT